MKALLILILALASLAPGQTLHLTGAEPVMMTADKLTHEGSVLRGSGHVEAKVGPFVLHGDQGTVHPETGEIDLRGHVNVTLPARTDHHLFRYDSQALVTDKPVELSADHMNLKNTLLQGSGHVKIRTEDGRLAGDQIVMYLNTADAEVRGNVQATGTGVGSRGHPDFPAEIIK